MRCKVVESKGKGRMGDRFTDERPGEAGEGLRFVGEVRGRGERERAKSELVGGWQSSAAALNELTTLNSDAPKNAPDFLPRRRRWSVL